MTNNTPLQSQGQGQVPLSSELSAVGKDAMILEGLKSESFISLRQLCDAKYQILLTENGLFTLNNNKAILCGKQNKYDGL